MSKVLVLIELDAEVYKSVENETYCGSLYSELRNGTIITDDLISREALKKEVEHIKDTGYDTNNEPLFDFVELTALFKLIDNAPTIGGKDDEGR